MRWTCGLYSRNMHASIFNLSNLSKFSTSGLRVNIYLSIYLSNYLFSSVFINSNTFFFFNKTKILKIMFCKTLCGCTPRFFVEGWTNKPKKTPQEVLVIHDGSYACILTLLNKHNVIYNITVFIRWMVQI